jgi:hypothetical protein
MLPNPFNLNADSIMTFAWVCFLSMWGGIASYIRKIKQGITKKFSFYELIGEMVISSFVGVITFFLCQTSNLDQTITAALVGLSGHMGSRAIYFIELFLRKKLGIAQCAKTGAEK